MAVTFQSPDGVDRTNLVFSTTSGTRFFHGTVPEGTVDVQVSLRGGAYTTDPSSVYFNGATSFTVPNPAAFPNGLDLFGGENVIGVRAVPLVGTVSQPATVTVYLLPSGVDTFPPPSGVSVVRTASTVDVQARGLTDTRVTGYNFYASTEPGGGVLGYTRLNVYPVTAYESSDETTLLYTLNSNNPVGDADPTFVRAVVQQESRAEVVQSTDVNSRVELPDGVTTLETIVTLSSLERIRTYTFSHNRLGNESSDPATIFVGAFASLPPSLPLYYVVTAVYYDTTTGIEYESYFSAEVVGNPVDVRITTTGLPVVSRQQILQNAITSIYGRNSTVAIQPGSVIRDTFLDPFTTEAERLRFIVDFMYRASSFDTLLQVDDPNATGTSIQPAASAYKTALAAAFFLSNPADIQPVIDGAFDKLAANFGVPRPAGERAIGEARFYTPVTPTRTLTVPLGTRVTGGSVQFRTTRAAELPLESLASFYNPVTRTYSVTVPIQAVNVGSDGNLDAGAIRSGAPYGFSVINDSETFGGLDIYSNAQLAALARGALSSVDTGTAQGYRQTAARTPGVIQVSVVEAGSPYMQRDLYNGAHVGNKVDVWTQGVRTSTITDTFAFSYETKRDVQFVVIGDPALYQFRSLDPSLTPDNPLASMLDYPSMNLGLKNITTGQEFDLTGVVIANYNTIVLSTSVPQPPVTLTDVVLGDYRYRTGDQYVFARQPVSYVASVVGEVSGALDTSTFYLVHPNGPLALGRSSQAGDYLQVNAPTGSANGAIGAPITETNELHVLTGFYTENVNALGADALSVVVRDSTGVTTYIGPNSPTGVPDYEVVDGTTTTPLGIRRTPASAIPDGSGVLIDYVHDENFVVTYQTNLVTSSLQANLNRTRHATANVLAKDAIQVPVNIAATVILQRGVVRSTVDQSIRDNLQYLVSNLRLGTPLRRSDVISAIDQTTGVSYVVVPLTTMARAVGTVVAREDITTSQFGSCFLISAWSTSSVQTWVLTHGLSAPPYQGGAPLGGYAGVFQDDVVMTLQASNPEQLFYAPNKAYIQGDAGLIIPGYSDDTTLRALGYVTQAEIDLARYNLTRGHILVSLPVGDSPVNHTYWSTYVVATSSGDNDVDPSPVEYLVLGDVSFTYDEDRA